MDAALESVFPGEESLHLDVNVIPRYSSVISNVIGGGGEDSRGLLVILACYLSRFR